MHQLFAVWLGVCASVADRYGSGRKLLKTLCLSKREISFITKRCSFSAVWLETELILGVDEMYVHKWQFPQLMKPSLDHPAFLQVIIYIITTFFSQFINGLVYKCASNSKICNVKWFKTVKTSFQSSNYRSYRTNVGALLAETIFQIRTSEPVSCLWLPAAHLLTAPAGRSHPDFLIIFFYFSPLTGG